MKPPRQTDRHPANGCERCAGGRAGGSAAPSTLAHWSLLQPRVNAPRGGSGHARSPLAERTMGAVTQPRPLLRPAAIGGRVATGAAAP